VPSGDHAGKASAAGFTVSRLWLVPFEFIKKTSPSPSRVDAKAICVPSGDQLGKLFAGVTRLDRSTAPDPKRFTNWTRGRPSTTDENAINSAPNGVGVGTGVRPSKITGSSSAAHARPASTAMITTLNRASRRRCGRRGSRRSDKWEFGPGNWLLFDEAESSGRSYPFLQANSNSP
jgi:hypothetical protein